MHRWQSMIKPAVAVILMHLSLAVERCEGTHVYVSGSGNQSAPYDSWTAAFTNLQDALDYAMTSAAGEGHVYLAGDQVFEGHPQGTTHPDNTVFMLRAVSNIVLRGGYRADAGSGENPGDHDPAQWPTTLRRSGGDARILTLIGVSNLTVEAMMIRDGYPLGLNAISLGGGVFIDQCPDITFADCQIVENTALGRPDAQGGGLYLSQSRVVLTNTLVADNQVWRSRYSYTTVSQGGGIYLDGDSELRLVRSLITGNEAQGHWNRSSYGGGIFVAGGGLLDLRETVVAGNQSLGHADVRHFPSAVQGFGGGIANYGTLRLRNSLIAGNRSNTEHSDGLLLGGGSAVVVHCTIADNSGVGLRYDAGTVAVSNSIVWGHDRRDLWGFPTDAQGILTNVWFSNIGDGQNIGRQGCHAVDPRFADRTHYHLQSSRGHYTNGYFDGGDWTNAATDSPLIDRGDPAAAFDGEPLPNGARANLGAYGNTATAALTPDVSVATAPAVTNPGALAWGHRGAILRGEVSDSGGETPMLSFNYWIDGTTETNSILQGLATGRVTRSVTDLTPGATYHYLVRATNSKGIAESAPASFHLRTSASALYVSTNGNHTAGTNWSTAYHCLQTAFDIAETGDTLYLAGHTFADGPLWQNDPTQGSPHAWLYGLMDTRYKTVFALRNVDAVTVRGGYHAGGDDPLPGPRDSNTWPTMLTRTGGVSRVLTVVNCTNLHIDQVTVTNGYAYDADASGFGAGIYLDGCVDTLISDSRLEDNRIVSRPTPQGGGLFLTHSSVTLTNCLIRGNTVTRSRYSYQTTARGGAVYVDGTSDLTIDQSIISGNRAEGHWGKSGYGGGLHVAAGGRLTVHRTRLDGNLAERTGGQSYWGEGYGGAIASYGTLNLRNTLVISNWSQTGGDGIWSSGAAAVASVESSTVADNNAIGLQRDGDGVFAVTNTIVWGQSDDLTDFPVDGEGKLLNVSHSLFAVPDTMAGFNGCIVDDPRFIDTAAGNYRLRNAFGVGEPSDTSPAIDAGKNQPWMFGATDADDRNRVMKGLTAGTAVIVDMGAYEAIPAGGSLITIR